MRVFGDLPTWGKVCVIVGAVFFGLVLIGALAGEGEEPSLKQGSSSSPAPALKPGRPTEEAATPEPVTMPNFKGRNAEKARSILEDMGVPEDDIKFGSPGGWVVLPENWTVVSSDPAPGSEIELGDTIVLTVRQ